MGASYSYDPASRTMVSYDTPGVAKLKADYITHKGLGGGMWWETSGDSSSRPLIKTVVDRWGSGRLDSTQNNLDYPASQYDNIKKGMN